MLALLQYYAINLKALKYKILYVTPHLTFVNIVRPRAIFVHMRTMSKDRKLLG